jgi:hypothetical protein
MFSKVINALFAGGLGAVDGILGRFLTNKDDQEANIHGETGQVLAAYAAEFSAIRGNRTWWDSLVDGLNRLPRPAMALGVMGLMAWAPIDPVGFSQAMRAYALVPEWLAGTLFGIAAFYFTARHFEKRMSFKAPETTAVRNALGDIQGMEAMRSENATISEREYQSAMDDGNIPLSNGAIAEWNRRRAVKM